MTRAAQLVRGASTASVAVALAGFSHGIAGREAPGGVGLVLAAMVALAASVAFVGRRSTPVRTTLAVVVSQGAFHLLFGIGVGASPTPATTGAGHVGHAGRAVHDAQVGHAGVVSLADGAGTAVAHADHSLTAMLVGHAVAAALTVIYLLAVERAAWQAAGSAARRFVLRLTGASLPAPHPLGSELRLAAAVTHRPLYARLLLSSLRDRGPPSPACAT
ncbi:hypothetical protein [Agromyces ramosus]|uniref:hypothetical protein n=1 Tax=Agromyces ramosus TaxID=33879 RepID=UPI0027D87139|nr:hypothetical protein [Agromyces ramosus]